MSASLALMLATMVPTAASSGTDGVLGPVMTGALSLTSSMKTVTVAVPVSEVAPESGARTVRIYLKHQQMAFYFFGEKEEEKTKQTKTTATTRKKKKKKKTKNKKNEKKTTTKKRPAYSA